MRIPLLALAAVMLPMSSVLAEALESRGLVRSSSRVEVRTDLVASVKKAPFGDGMRFSKGDKLMQFDCRRYQAELNAARATANAAYISVRDKKRLFNAGAAGKSELQLAQAESSKASADVKARKARMRDCTIVAPFNGRVVMLNTRKHEMPTASEPIITLIDDSVLELELVVSSTWLTWLERGQVFRFKVDETGKVYEGEIVRLGAEVDPVSQTIKAYGQLNGDLAAVLAGMSGTAQFKGQGS